MNLFEWSPKYSVQIESLDNDHKGLFSIINQLYQAMSQGKASDILTGLVDQLVKYTRIHFTREEMLFKSTDFHYYAEHKAQHEAFIRKVNEFRENLARGDKGFSVEMLGFLRDWLIKHIFPTLSVFTTCSF
jgi:hemerythrin-like metal-binding protein